MQVMILLVAFSLLASCAGIKRPNAELCIVNAPARHLKCYNLYEDYEDSGLLKKNATAKFFRAETVEDLNKGTWMSNADWAELKKWIREIRKAYDKERLK